LGVGVGDAVVDHLDEAEDEECEDEDDERYGDESTANVGVVVIPLCFPEVVDGKQVDIFEYFFYECHFFK